MKIGLVTIYQVPNYGSVLQAFATQHLLEKMGAECRIINYYYPNQWHYSQGAKKRTGIRTWIRSILPSKKFKNLDMFRRSYLHLTKPYEDLDQLTTEDWSSYDAFVVGSDQVWNPRFLRADKTFMLSFVPNDKPRYSLSSSFATDTIPEIFRKKYFDQLSKFNALSVREQNGVSVINDELGLNKNVKVLLDPTLLLSKEDWLKCIPRSGFKNKRPYIVLYLLKYSFEPRPYIFEVVKHFKEKMQADVIALCGYEKPNIACGIVMQDAFSSTVPEFIDIIANADLIVTSSFHGTAFALNFGVPLISVVPSIDSDDRQTTLLKSLDVKSSICKIGSTVENLNPFYDTNRSSLILSSLRKDNISWINNNIF